MRTKLFFAMFLIFSSLYAIAEVNPTAETSYCLACDVPNGLAVSDLTGASATLSWNAVNGATQYTLEVEDEQVTPSVFHLETNVNGTSYALTGLQSGVMYKFKVRARCGGDKSDWSDWVFLTAGNGGGSSSDTCTAPLVLSASVNGTTATLSWNKVSGATQYYLEVEDEQNGPSTFHLEVPVQDTFYVLAGLQANVLYKFKVRTHCAGSQSVWSAWSFFNGNLGGGNGGGSGNCDKPSNPQVSNITATAALLTWNAVPGVASYFLEIERKQTGSAPWQMTQTVSTNSFLLTGLNANTRYKFKVRSNCSGGGHSKWTKWEKFKTAPNLTGTPGGANLQNIAANRNNDDQTMVGTALEVMVWPNPIQSDASVRLQNLSAEPVTLRLFDLAGRLVQEQHITSEERTWEGTLHVGNLPNGLYLLHAKSGADSRTIKLLVNHE